MKIRLQDRLSAAGANRHEAGDSFAKLLTGIAILSVAATGLYGALAPAYRVIRSTRQNLRASQVVMQKAERVFAVPLHEELKKGTLNAILKQAGLEIDDLQR